MMLNRYELDWIMKAAKAFKSSQEAIIKEMEIMPSELHLDNTAELLKCANDLEFAEDLIAKIKAEQEEQEKNAFVALDADHQGELLVLCAELHTAWNQEFADTQSTNTQDILDAYYLLGNIEGRLKSGRVTMDDLGMLEAWQEELENE